jgi:hypothetical protein
MDPQLGRGAFRIAFFIAFTSLVLLIFVRPGSAEFVITVLSLTMGILFGAVIVVLARVFGR